MPADGLSRLEEVKEAEAQPIPPVVTLDQVHYLQKSDKWIKALACFLKFKLYPRDLSLQQCVDQLANASVVKQGIVYVMC